MKSDETKTEVFDGVLIATGHHSYPYIPDFRDMKLFKGSIIHTHSLKKAAGYEDKTVLIIGIGNSAVDAAVEISTVAKKVGYFSWFFIRKFIRNFQKIVSVTLVYKLKTNFQKETTIKEFYAFIDIECEVRFPPSHITYLSWNEKLLDEFKNL